MYTCLIILKLVVYVNIHAHKQCIRNVPSFQTKVTNGYIVLTYISMDMLLRGLEAILCLCLHGKGLQKLKKIVYN